jgi:SAM-dependent methyltransferase
MEFFLMLRKNIYLMALNAASLLTLAGIFLGLITTLSWAMEEREESNFTSEIRQWLPSHLHTSEDIIKSQIRQEKRSATMIDNPQERRDFGFSIEGLNPAMTQCLFKIKERFEMTEQRPAVLDAGAGIGNMTWKMITAGGHVTAVEKQMKTAVQLPSSIVKAKPFLREREGIKPTFKLFTGDVLEYLLADTSKYYLSWSGLLLHFLNPTQAQDYVAKLFAVTENGGYAFATVNPPCGDPKVVEFYNDREGKGDDFPGYCVIVKRKKSTYFAETDETKGEATEILEVSSIRRSDNNLPGKVVYGTYKKPTSEAVPEVISHTPGSTGITVANYYEHIYKHFFGPKALENLFVKAGFVTEDLFYIGPRGKIPLTKMDADTLFGGYYFLAIIAQKPE